MSKRFSKPIAILLVFIMVVGMLPVIAFAASGDTMVYAHVMRDPQSGRLIQFKVDDLRESMASDGKLFDYYLTLDGPVAFVFAEEGEGGKAVEGTEQYVDPQIVKDTFVAASGAAGATPAAALAAALEVRDVPETVKNEPIFTVAPDEEGSFEEITEESVPDGFVTEEGTAVPDIEAPYISSVTAQLSEGYITANAIIKNAEAGDQATFALYTADGEKVPSETTVAVTEDTASADFAAPTVPGLYYVEVTFGTLTRISNSVEIEEITPELDEELLAELQDAKDAADALIEGDYDAELWAEFTAALTAALDLPETTNDELTAKIAAINEAIEILDDEGGGEPGAVTISSIKIIGDTMIEVTLSGVPYGGINVNDFAVAEFKGSQTTARTIASQTAGGVYASGDDATASQTVSTVTIKNDEANVYVLTLSTGITTDKNWVAVDGKNAEWITGLASAQYVDAGSPILTENSVGETDPAVTVKVSGLDSALYYSVKVITGADAGFYIADNSGTVSARKTPQYIKPDSSGEFTLVDGVTYEVLESDATEPLFTEASLVIAELDNTASYNVIVADGLGTANNHYVKSDSTTQAGAATVNGAQAKALTLVNGATYTVTIANNATLTLSYSGTGNTSPAVPAGYYKLAIGGSIAPGYVDEITGVVIEETLTVGTATQSFAIDDLTTNAAKTEIYIPGALIENIFPGVHGNQTVKLLATGFAPLAATVGTGNVVDTVAPVLSQVGSAIRESNIAVDITLKSIEAGTSNGGSNVTLYYKSGTSASAVVDAANKTGTAAVGQNNTAYLLDNATLSAGAQVVSIVLVDARGNVSNRLDISVPAFVEGFAGGQKYTKAKNTSAQHSVAIVDGKLMLGGASMTEREILPGSQNYDGIMSLMEQLNIGDSFELTNTAGGSLITKIHNDSGEILNLTLDKSIVSSALELKSFGAKITASGDLTGVNTTLVSNTGGGRFDLKGLTAHGGISYNTNEAAVIELGTAAKGDSKLSVNSGTSSAVVNISAPVSAQIAVNQSTSNVTINNVLVNPTGTANPVVTVTGANSLDIVGSNQAITIDASKVTADTSVRFITVAQTAAVTLVSTKNAPENPDYTLTLDATASSNGAIALGEGRYNLSSANIVGNLTVTDGGKTATIVSGSTLNLASSRTITLDNSDVFVVENGATTNIEGVPNVPAISGSGSLVVEAGATVIAPTVGYGPTTTLFGATNSVYTINTGKVTITASGSVQTTTLGAGDKLTLNKDFGLGTNYPASTGEVIKLDDATAEFIVGTGATLHINGQASNIDVDKGIFTIAGTVRLNNDGTKNLAMIDLANDTDAKMVIATGGKLGIVGNKTSVDTTFIGKNGFTIGDKAIVEGFSTTEITSSPDNTSNVFYKTGGNLITTSAELSSEAGAYVFNFDVSSSDGEIGWKGGAT